MGTDEGILGRLLRLEQQLQAYKTLYREELDELTQSLEELKLQILELESRKQEHPRVRQVFQGESPCRHNSSA